mgnify:CR=1 FL=1
MSYKYTFLNYDEGDRITINNMLFECEGGKYLHPIINDEVYGKILVKDCRKLYGDGRTFECIYYGYNETEHGCDRLFVCPTTTHSLKEFVLQEYNRLEKTEESK